MISIIRTRPSDRMRSSQLCLHWSKGSLLGHHPEPHDVTPPVPLPGIRRLVRWLNDRRVAYPPSSRLIRVNGAVRHANFASMPYALGVLSEDTAVLGIFATL